MVGFGNNEKTNPSYYQRSMEEKYRDKVGNWVKVFTEDGAFEGRLERLTNEQFVLRPKLSLITNDEGWDEYKITNNELAYDLKRVKGMEKKSRASSQRFCQSQNMFGKFDYIEGLKRIGAIRDDSTSNESSEEQIE